MKRIVVAAVLALVTAPSAFAQLNPPPPIISIVVASGAPTNGLVGAYRLAQPFSLSSPSYISEIELFLEHGGASCTYSVAITKSLGPGADYGPPLLVRAESVSSAGYFVLSDTFPAILLNAGSYFLILDPTTGAYPCSSIPGDSTTQVGLYWQTARSDSGVGTVSNPEGAGDQWAPLLQFPEKFVLGFVLAGPTFLPPTGGGSGQIARLIVQGPVRLAPGGPVEAQIGFLNPATGTPVAPLSPVTLSGQAQSVDVALNSLGTRLGQHVSLLPVIAQLPGTVQSTPLQLSSTVQILDAITGFGSVSSPAPQPGAPVSAFGPQILAGGQTLRVTVVAGTDPCVVQVAFNDLNGNPLVQSTPLNLLPGAGTSVDLNADSLSLKLGQRIEAQPALTATAPAAAVPLNSVCQASAEVFDHLSGRTWNYQSTMAALPAVQTPAAGPQ